MPADFAPDLNYTASGMGGFRFWCQKTLPLVYDDSLSYYELLCKLTKFLSDAVEDISTLDKAYKELEDYVNNYFDSLDVQEAINAKLDEMADDGTLGALISTYITRNKDVVIVTASFGDPQECHHANTFTALCKARIEASTNIKVYYGYQSGAGFATDNYYGATYMQAIDMALLSIPDPSTIGQIIVVGGGNDVGHAEFNISVGMDNFMTYCKSRFPNAIYRFCWCSWRLRLVSSRSYELYNQCIAIHKKLCGMKGIGYCPNSEYILHQYDPDWYQSDGLHPTEVASDYLSTKVTECIFTGGCDVIREETFVNNPTEPDEEPNPFMEYNGDTFSFSYLANFTVRQVNENTYIIPANLLANQTLTMSSGVIYRIRQNPADHTATTPFANLRTKLFNGLCKTFRYGNYPIRIATVDDNSSPTIVNTIMGEIRFYDSKLYLQGLRDSNYQSVGGSGYAYFYFPEIVIPTAYC